MWDRIKRFLEAAQHTQAVKTIETAGLDIAFTAIEAAVPPAVKPVIDAVFQAALGEVEGQPSQPPCPPAAK